MKSKYYHRESWNLRNQGRETEMVNTWINSVDYFAPPQFFRMLKFLTLSNSVFSVC